MESTSESDGRKNAQTDPPDDKLNPALDLVDNMGIWPRELFLNIPEEGQGEEEEEEDPVGGDIMGGVEEERKNGDEEETTGRAWRAKKRQLLPKRAV